MDTTIESTAARIFTDHADNPDRMWSALEDSELTRAWIPEPMDGAGLPITDVFGLIRLSGTSTCAIPYAETLLAGYLLSQVGIPVPSGAISISVALDVVADDTVNRDDVKHHKTTDVFEIPYAQQAEHLVTVSDSGTLSLYSADTLDKADLAPTNSVGSDPLYQVSTAGLQSVATTSLSDPTTIDTINRIGALVRSAQMCGAMEAILDLTLEHTSTREQFGRPLAKFQAVQHLLAEIAGEAAASSAMIEAAVETFEQHNKPDLRNTACAKARTSEAVGIIAANAHQAHGAIGYTQEYALSTYTRRLWRWREEFGNETQWSFLLGSDYLQTHAGPLTTEFFQ
jgi:acyl-CoA dehydrogenase